MWGGSPNTLSYLVVCAYLPEMAEDTKPTTHPWLAELERGRADVAAGRTCDFEEFIGQLESDDAALVQDVTQDGPAPGR